MGRFKYHLFVATLIFAMACVEEHVLEDVCEPGPADSCEGGQICETMLSGETGCFNPVVIRGRVFEQGTDEGISGARVAALDGNSAALGAIAKTNSRGDYALTVPMMRLDENGDFEGFPVMLRVDAHGYLGYPTGFRPSIPIDLEDVNPGGGEYTVENPVTDVALIPLSGDSDALGMIQGRAHGANGALVVAETDGATQTGIADSLGDYVVFNLEPGDYTVTVYEGGCQYESLEVDVDTGDRLDDLDFDEADDAEAALFGNVQFVDAAGLDSTSVVLVVASTYHPSLGRGEAPPGLWVAEVGGEFCIEGVPDGEYVVLAALENDDLVRDPAGDVVYAMVDGESVWIEGSIRVTEALVMDGPGADGPEEVDDPLVFTWMDDSSEDGYELVVFDAYGETFWKDTLDSVSGDEWVEFEYDGPSLDDEMYYQWRATSVRDGEPISATEDLRGVFYID